MRTEFDHIFWLLEFDEREAVEETHAADETVAVLGEFRHEPHGSALPPTTNLDLYVVNIVGAALPRHDARNGGRFTIFDGETDELPNLGTEDAVIRTAVD